MSDADRIAEVALPLIHEHCERCLFHSEDGGWQCPAGHDVSLCWWAHLEHLILRGTKGEN